MQQAYINWKCHFLLIMPIIDVFDNISGYRRYKIIVFRRTPASGGYHGADSTLPVTSFGLRCWAQWHWYFTHFKLFYFPNVIGLVQRIVRFVMRTEPKASYRTVQYEPLIYIYIYVAWYTDVTVWYVPRFGGHGSIRFRYNRKKKNLLCSVSFHLFLKITIFFPSRCENTKYYYMLYLKSVFIVSVHK